MFLAQAVMTLACSVQVRQTGDRTRIAEAIVGKVLAALYEARGLIPILVVLQ
jgi:hypothetical protein